MAATGSREVSKVARLAVTREEAADLLDVSVDSFRRNVEPQIRTTRIGRLVRIPVAEIRRYVEANQA